MKVKDCMCDDVCCVKPETKITEVAKELLFFLYSRKVIIV